MRLIPNKRKNLTITSKTITTSHIQHDRENPQLRSQLPHVYRRIELNKKWLGTIDIGFQSRLDRFGNFWCHTHLGLMRKHRTLRLSGSPTQLKKKAPHMGGPLQGLFRSRRARGRVRE